MTADLKGTWTLRPFQTNSSKPGLSRAGEVFHVSVIPISVWKTLLHATCLVTLIWITLTYNTEPALLSPALLLFVWTWLRKGWLRTIILLRLLYRNSRISIEVIKLKEIRFASYQCLNKRNHGNSFSNIEACFQKSFSSPLYSQQQNKWYRQWFLLAHFEATLYFSRTELKNFWGYHLFCC